MKTQVLVHQMERKYVGVDAGSQIVVKGFGKADAFDAYDMTVADLQSSEIWRNKGNSTGEINYLDDWHDDAQIFEMQVCGATAPEHTVSIQLPIR